MQIGQQQPPTSQLEVDSSFLFYNCMNQHKFKQIQSKLNSLTPNEEGEHSNKAKIRNIQQLIAKLHHRLKEEDANYQHKITVLFESLRKVQNSLKDNGNGLEIEDANWNNRAAKMEKSLKKALERVTKEQKQSDKKLSSSLETYLIELTGFKGKAGSSCAASIRELRELEKDVQYLQREAQHQKQLSQDIYKKVYVQFSAQIEQIRNSVAEQGRLRQETEERVLQSIERMYNALSGSIVQARRARQRQQRQIVELLERVIEKLKREITSD